MYSHFEEQLERHLRERLERSGHAGSEAADGDLMRKIKESVLAARPSAAELQWLLQQALTGLHCVQVHDSTDVPDRALTPGEAAHLASVVVSCLGRLGMVEPADFDTAAL